jgi:DNA-binding transcriptional regulator GbsR (MarR family)
MDTAQSQTKLDTEQIVNDILGSIDREREREIIARRFGLFDRKETLEQIGELLGITRERVRQLEKVVITKLRASADKLPHIDNVQSRMTEELSQIGKVARVSDLSARLTKDNSKTDQARIAFLGHLSPNIAVIEDNDHFFHSVGLMVEHGEKAIREAVHGIIETIKTIGEPTSIEVITEKSKHKDPVHVMAMASISKQIATLNGRWGLVKWPMVNPKNIRDKIYVVLYEQGKPMHFNEIAETIKMSDFKRKDVTTQAIHNELIKDKRFVLIGRGIYALKEWGYKKGTVSDVIVEVLKKEGKPLHRDEIVKRVLKTRHVKETTILLNLQGKPEFKRTAKATYTLA